MSKKKNQSRKSDHAQKSALESLRFQTLFGLKQMGCGEDGTLCDLAETELSFISQLDLTQDLLGIKKLVDGARASLHAEPTPERGDFCTSITAIALGIARVANLDAMQMPVSWEEQIDKKLLAIYYPEDSRNEVAAWAKSNGYNTSTYLGCPIVKFSQLYVKLERTRA